MKILAFAGSTSSTSINKELVKFVLKSFRDHQIDLIDLNDYSMPIFTVDLEKKKIPNEAHQFLERVKACDAIICSLAEHNRTYCAAFKNIFDWTSRVDLKLFQGKPMMLMTTSPGAYGGGNVMNVSKTFFPEFGADIRVTFSLPTFYQNFDKQKGIIDAELAKELMNKIDGFKQQLTN